MRSDKCSCDKSTQPMLLRSQSVLLANCFVLYSFVTVGSNSTSSSDRLYASAYFFLTFSEDLDIFRLISYKLRLFTLQLLWRGRNDAKIAIMRMFISGYNRIPNHLNTLRVDAKIFVSAKKYLRKKKFPDTCGHGLSCLNYQDLHGKCPFADPYNKDNVNKKMV